jgi:cellulose synthase/poly-beta-1,6-N-acetylglucosamine synthase-like glycosyltransferase
MIIHWWQWLFYCFCLVALIQVLYYLIFFARLAFYESKQKNITQTHPVSVIICARDEATNLVKNLPGALVQKYSTSHEVIVVNDNSFDESKYILEAYQKTFRQLQIVELKQEARFIPGKKYPLTVGIKTARYEVVLLTDADCTPASEHWIQKMQEGYREKTEIVLGYGGQYKVKGFLNKLVRWETFHTALQYLSYACAGLAYMGVGRNLSYKKAVFFRNKGFSSHNHIASGDDDLFINTAATKKNTEIVIDKDAFTLTTPPKTWGQWRRQKTRHFSTGTLYKSSHKILLGLYAFTHFVFYPLFITCLIFCDWKIVLAFFVARFLLQSLIFYRAMAKLDEKDLFAWFLVFDVWMFFYYLIFSVAMVRKPGKTWN